MYYSLPFALIVMYYRLLYLHNNNIIMVFYVRILMNESAIMQNFSYSTYYKGRPLHYKMYPNPSKQGSKSLFPTPTVQFP